jgi:hypothetical protein
MYPYKDVAFTKHARERMDLRVISEEMVLKVIHKPDNTYPEDDGDIKFIRNVNGAVVHVVCKPIPEESKWLVKSTWVRGEDDYGNRVDRQGRYLGKRRRAMTPTSQPSAGSGSGMWINAALFALLMFVLVVLFYVLTR